MHSAAHLDGVPTMSTRFTKNRQKILALLQQLEGEISAQQLHLELHQQGSRIGLATVYRTLKSLHWEGLVQERATLAGESLYSLVADAHHHYHHLNCIYCGNSIPLQDGECQIGKQLNRWCQTQNFKVYYHTLEFFGLCDTCQHQLEELNI
jgi:Fur family ferric uptake transcriptional regulator